MGSKHIRYRVGIDVGLYSVGLSAIEIDDSNDDPRTALPIKLLSTMSVIHDAGVDPDKAKEADSRKASSGVARRTRRMRKRTHQRLTQLDLLLEKFGFPIAHAKQISEGAGLERSGIDPSYPAWNARIHAAEQYIENQYERNLTVAVAIRHIARHRGWRNPYSRSSSLFEISRIASQFYEEFFTNIQLWRNDNGLDLYPGVCITANDKGKEEALLPESLATDPNRPTPAKLIEDFLDPNLGIRFRSEKATPDAPSTQIGKLHQSDYFNEVLRIFQKQNIPNDQQKELLDAIFFQINPRDVGSAATLVATDDLPGQEKLPRASKASLAFQRYRILTTLTNLRIKTGPKASRPLEKEEIRNAYDYLCEADSESLSWQDVAECLGVARNSLSGIGGYTEDGEPISIKRPPVLNTEIAIKKASKIDMHELRQWWDQSSELEKEFFIECLSNTGIASNRLSEAENRARNSVNEFLQSLPEEALEKLDKPVLASGRAAYSVDSLNRLNERMLNDGVDLHTARRIEFGVDDSWQPSPNQLGTSTGNPAVDRTISEVSRWIKACQKRWGDPETVNIEHVREGFSSPKMARQHQRGTDKRYKANLKIREQIIRSLEEEDGLAVRGIDAISHADIRRYQAVQRQNCQCVYCGRKITFQTAQMDHIVPRKGPGSSNDLPNLVAACASCNANKNNTLFYSWATPEKRAEVLERIDGWNRDSYFSSDRQFRNYIKDVKSRLMQKEEDEPLDVRSIESVAWMARELRNQIEGYFEYRGVVSGHTEGNNDFGLQRVNVYRGSLTAEARKASGIENTLPWIDGNGRKTRMDRRHHAIDASIIAMMRPAVGKVLVERAALRRDQIESNICTKDQFRRFGKRFWKEYTGGVRESDLYLHWRDVQMQALKDLLCKGMANGKIVVTNRKRLRLGNSRSHEDEIRKLVKRHVGDELSVINIDKAESPALWLALTNHPDFDPKTGLPEDRNRRIRIHDRWLSADDNIGFMAESDIDFNRVTNAVCIPVRGGYARIGQAFHHVRFYRIPKTNSKGHQTGWEFALLRVCQADLVKHQKENLFEIALPPQSISCRSATSKLRKALADGTAVYLGWAVIGDEIKINPADPYFSPERNEAINVFMKAFPGISHFKITGLPSNSKLRLEPLYLSSEGLEDALSHTKGDKEWTDRELTKIKAVLGDGGSFRPEINPFFNTLPTIIRRNALGEVRWKSKNHMPISWKVTPHPEIE